MHLNSLIAFQDYETQAFDFADVKELYSFTGKSNVDYVSFSCYADSCFYKTILDSEIGTFISCNYN
jgi:hypothetical protein